MFINYPSINIVLSNLGKQLISSTDFYWSSSKEQSFSFINNVGLTNVYLGIAGVVYDSSNWNNSRNETLNKSSIRLVRPFKRF